MNTVTVKWTICVLGFAMWYLLWEEVEVIHYFKRDVFNSDFKDFVDYSISFFQIKDSIIIHDFFFFF